MKDDDITAITKGDKDPIIIQAKVTPKGSKEPTFLMFTQNNDVAQGDGKGNAIPGTTNNPEAIPGATNNPETAK